MNRVDIFHKYFVNTRKSNHGRDRKLDVSIDGVDYSGFRINEKLWIYTVHSIAYKDLRAHGFINEYENDIIIKLNIQSCINNMPVMAVPYLEIHGYDGVKRIHLDFVDSDLSNILTFRLLSAYINISILRLPESKERRLKPVDIGEIFSLVTDKQIHQLMKNIDTSEVVYANGLFSNSYLETIDFDAFGMPKLNDATEMFYNCSKLKSVTGRLAGNTCVMTYSMFKCCTELKTISKNLFSDIKICRTSEMFYECYSLVSIPKMHIVKFDDTVHKYGVRANVRYLDAHTNMFYHGYSIPEQDIRDTIIECVKHKIYVENIMSGVKVGSVLSGMTIDMSKSHYLGLLHDCEGNQIDLSGVKFTYPDNSDEHVFGILDLIYGSHKEHTSDNSLYNRNYINLNYDEVFMECKYIITANRTLRLNPLDYKVFKVVDGSGLSNDDIHLMINKAKALGSTYDRYIFIMD